MHSNLEKGRRLAKASHDGGSVDGMAAWEIYLTAHLSQLWQRGIVRQTSARFVCLSVRLSLSVCLCLTACR